MTRMYIQPSWIDAAADHNEWSGGNGQYRGDKSADIATFDKNGRARVEAFSDDAITNRREAKKTSISIQDRILPQQRRVMTLTNQMVELVATYKAGEMDIEEYSALLDVLVVKKNRAQVLLNKALNTKPVRFDDEEDEQDSWAEEYTDMLAHKEAYGSQNEDTMSLVDKVKSKANELVGFVVLSAIGCAGFMWLVS